MRKYRQGSGKHRKNSNRKGRTIHQTITHKVIDGKKVRWGKWITLWASVTKLDKIMRKDMMYFKPMPITITHRRV